MITIREDLAAITSILHQVFEQPSFKRDYDAAFGKIAAILSRYGPGLCHFAILLPERKNLADVLLYLSNKQDEVHFDGLANHLVSEATYIRDPDFNGVEIYSNRPQAQ